MKVYDEVLSIEEKWREEQKKKGEAARAKLADTAGETKGKK